MSTQKPTLRKRQHDAARAAYGDGRHRQHTFRPAPDSPGWERCEDCPKMRLSIIPTLDEFAQRVADYCNDPSLVREAEAILERPR